MGEGNRFLKKAVPFPPYPLTFRKNFGTKSIIKDRRRDKAPPLCFFPGPIYAFSASIILSYSFVSALSTPFRAFS